MIMFDSMYFILGTYFISTLCFSYKYREEPCQSNSTIFGLFVCFIITGGVFYWFSTLQSIRGSSTLTFVYGQVFIISLWNVVRLFTSTFDQYKQHWSDAHRFGPVIFLMIASFVSNIFFAGYLEYRNLAFYLLLVFSSGIIAQIHQPIIVNLINRK
ncbi:hypothetical protein CWN93_21060 [Vibrio splendidus]|nr:hypothetical protein CWN93_21060 [Vibrio splendidus]